MKVTPELLRRFDALAELPAPDLDFLAERSEVRKLARRGVVVEAGVPAPCVSFLFEGRLQGVSFTLDGREVGLYFVGPGDFCGELTLFDQLTSPEYVVALSRSVVVEVPVSALREVMYNSRALIDAFFCRAAQRIRLMSSQRTLLGVPSIPQRVCMQLCMLASIDAEPADSAVYEIVNPPTHQEIAIMLNLSRESVTRVFQSLQSEGVVRRDGNTRLVLEKPVRIWALAEGRDTV